MNRLNKHPQIIKIKNVINDIIFLPDELSNELSEYYCNIDMILEYFIDDLKNNIIKIYVEGEDLSINFGDNNACPRGEVYLHHDEYIELKINKDCKHEYSKIGTYKVTIRGILY